MRLEIQIDREPGEGRWIADVPGLPGCVARADSEGEALLRVQARALRLLAERLEHDAPAPELLDVSFSARRHPSLKTGGAASPELDGAQALERLRVVPAELARLCAEHGVAELSLFGSVLRADFRLDSDVDALVTFLPETEPDLLDLAGLEFALGELFRRRVDLVPRTALKPHLANAVLSTARVIHAAGRGLPPRHAAGA